MAHCLSTREALPRRYTNNVYHQAELAVPMALLLLSSPHPISSIRWSFPPLPWCQAILRLVSPSLLSISLPSSPLDRSSVLPISNKKLRTVEARGKDCIVFGPSSSPGSYFRSAAEASLLRERVHSLCRLPRLGLPSFSFPRRVLVLYMPRTGVSLQSGLMRNFARERELLSALRASLPSASLKTIPTPGDSVPLCKQVSCFCPRLASPLSPTIPSHPISSLLT